MPKVLLFILLMPSTIANAEWASSVPQDSQFPEVIAMDQHGQLRNSNELAGTNGLVFLFNRSVTW